MTAPISNSFPRYTEYDPAVPVWCVTPGTGRVIHRFFDTSPISPSGRYVGLTRLPAEDRLPTPGEVAEVVLVDLETGGERVVAETRGWDTQLGAQVQWGADDTQLCFNDVVPGEWKPFGVVLNPRTGDRKELEGGVYMLSPDGALAASPCLLRTATTQAGYGVLAPPEVIPENRGAADDDGIFVTDLATGQRRLLVSLEEIVEATLMEDRGDEYANGDFYGAHVKWSPQGDRIMLVLRWLPRDRSRDRKLNVVTVKADGSDINIAIPASEWSKGGHHPNWCPDGEHVMMNLAIHGKGKGMYFVRARYDGTDCGPMTEAVPGSGHPTLNADGRHIVTDEYVGASLAFDDGTVPLRLIDIETGTEKQLCRINTRPKFSGPDNMLRVDPHPAWDYGFRRIAFNAFPDGTRRVFVADLTEEIEASEE